MTVTETFKMANSALTNNLAHCERSPGVWCGYTTSASPHAPKSTTATLLIRRPEQESEMPVFDVMFTKNNTAQDGKVNKQAQAMTSRELQDATGLDHGAHYKQQTGKDAVGTEHAIFYQVSPREINALANVALGIATQRLAEYQTRKISHNTNFELGIDNNQDVTNSSHEFGNDR